jgi:hypothetical protein
VGVPDLAHEKDIRVLPDSRSQQGLEGDPDFFVYLLLVREGDALFNGILD